MRPIRSLLVVVLLSTLVGCWLVERDKDGVVPLVEAGKAGGVAVAKDIEEKGIPVTPSRGLDLLYVFISAAGGYLTRYGQDKYVKNAKKAD